VTGILDRYGWLGAQEVGMEKYLPMIQKAEKEGKILSSNLAIPEDRVAMRKGEKQIYGSQVITDRTTGKRYMYPRRRSRPCRRPAQNHGNAADSGHCPRLAPCSPSTGSAPATDAILIG
jgi:hypothetical protein